jgi:hypothetical protein
VTFFYLLKPVAELGSGLPASLAPERKTHSQQAQSQNSGRAWLGNVVASSTSICLDQEEGLHSIGGVQHADVEADLGIKREASQVEYA